MTFGFRTGVKVLSRQKPSRCTTVRGILTSIQEPPINSSVPEHPCTLILAQDDGLDDSDQWKSCFETVTNHGFSQAQWSTQATDLDSALVEMGQDLSPIPSPVWIARGPWTSWMAQFYLESLHLSGLVLVDPLPLDQGDQCRQQDQTRTYRTSVPRCDSRWLAQISRCPDERAIQQVVVGESRSESTNGDQRGHWPRSLPDGHHR